MYTFDNLFNIVTLLSNAGVPNVTAELAEANNYPNIRVFTVGQGNQSNTPFTQLASIEQPWAVASNLSIGVGGWSAFSAACWFTYRDVYNKLGGNIPQGLISNNWGGTPVEHVGISRMKCSYINNYIYI